MNGPTVEGPRGGKFLMSEEPLHSLHWYFYALFLLASLLSPKGQGQGVLFLMSEVSLYPGGDWTLVRVDVNLITGVPRS